MLKMLSGLKDKLFQTSHTETVKDDLHTDIHGRQIPGAEVFFYPQQIRGVPVFDIESVLKHYRADLKKLERFLPIGDNQKVNGRKLFDVMYMDIIKRFAEYVHLIPASEDHHHRGPGGLLIHSIEAAFNALTYAENKKYEKTGFLDIDKEMSTRARYATWVGGLLHDTGKILRDLHVNAVDVIVNAKTGEVAPARNVPTWLPHMQTLIEWAKEYHVATYTVSFVRGRKHNRHNIESNQLLPYIMGRDYALKYLVDTPGANLYSELNNLLSGIETQSYISRAVREGDALSTAKDMTVYYDAMLGVKTMSVGSRVCVLMKLAKVDFEWNTPGGAGWIIDGECYLQWPTAIDAIIKASVKNEIAIPHEHMALVDLMENHGLIKPYSLKQRSVKFSKGQFTTEDAIAIQEGKKEVRWEELIKVSWDGHLFGDDPKPNNCKGLMYLTESAEYLFIDRFGNAKLLHTGTAQDDGAAKQAQKSLPAPEQNTKPQESSQQSGEQVKAKPAKAPAAKPAKKDAAEKPAESVPAQDVTETKPAEAAAVPASPKTVSAQFDISDVTGELAPQQTSGITFKRRKKEQQPENENSSVAQATAVFPEAEQQLRHDSAVSSLPTPPAVDIQPAAEAAPAKQQIAIPAAIQALLDKGAKAWSYDGQYYLEIGSETGIGQAELKAIKSQHLSTDSGLVLAQKYTLGTKTIMAAKLKEASGRMLAAGGVVSLAETVEVQTEQPKKPKKQAAAKDETQTQEQAVAAAPASKNESTPLKPIVTAASTTYPEGTLGWILIGAGVDTECSDIIFEKSVVKAAYQNAGRRLKWTVIEKTIRDAGYAMLVTDTTITVKPEALNAVYWTPEHE